MSIGFRPTEEDNEIIQAHKRTGESTADVLRRALRSLDREEWERQAREDMERIAASGEDLSTEPDDWGFDEAGEAVLFQQGPASESRPAAGAERAEHTTAFGLASAEATRAGVPGLLLVPEVKAVQDAIRAAHRQLPNMQLPFMQVKWSQDALRAAIDIHRQQVNAPKDPEAGPRLASETFFQRPPTEVAASSVHFVSDLKAYTSREHEPSASSELDQAHHASSHHPLPPKLARLHAAVRRASRR
ncbi:hypothetical protein [Streptomyces sp. NPDC055189]